MQNQKSCPGGVVVRPSSGWKGPGFRELWEFRELLAILVWREIKLRYRHAVLGVLWAILQPLAAMAVFAFFLGRLARVPSDGLPYPLFVLAGLLPWNFFFQSLTQATGSLVSGAQLVQKVYFPRLILPAASVIAGLLDLAAAGFLLAVVLAFYGVAPGVRWLALPLFLGIAVAAAMGVGAWLSALNVRYRDVRHALPFTLQLWMFATPVIYPSSLLAEPWRTLYGLNPMTGAVEGFRWALLGAPLACGQAAVSGGVSLALLATGVMFFRRTERLMADHL